MINANNNNRDGGNRLVSAMRETIVLPFNSIRPLSNGINASAQMHPDMFSKNVVCLQSGSNFQFSR